MESNSLAYLTPTQAFLFRWFCYGVAFSILGAIAGALVPSTWLQPCDTWDPGVDSLADQVLKSGPFFAGIGAVGGAIPAAWITLQDLPGPFWHNVRAVGISCCRWGKYVGATVGVACALKVMHVGLTCAFLAPCILLAWLGRQLQRKVSARHQDRSHCPLTPLMSSDSETAEAAPDDRREWKLLGARLRP